MPLPAVIEIVPLAGPIEAEITVPGSKSITNRALILAALAAGETTLQGALWSEDTQVMIDCLRELGFKVEVARDPDEASNRVITVEGKGGFVPGSSEEQPVELFVGNAGTAARFLVSLVCLGKGAYWLHGVPRMHQRPQAALFKALRSLGYQIDSQNDKLPAKVHGGGPKKGKCEVSIEESSQFASALLLAGHGHGWEVEVTGANPEEQPYVDMTRELIKVFPANGGTFQIEPDASSGSYFLGAGWLLHEQRVRQAQVAATSPSWQLPGEGADHAGAEPVSVSVSYWPSSGWQIDAEFIDIVSARVPHFVCGQGGPNLTPYRRIVPLPQEISREQHLGDSIMTAAVLAPLMERSVRLTNLGRLRVQETERVAALRVELTRCGAEVVEEGDTLTILPSAEKLHGAEIETYNDHRMAMCFAILGLKIPGIKIKNPACVKKTFPDFFQKLATPPPRGLGATIRDPATGLVLRGDELFAE